MIKKLSKIEYEKYITDKESYTVEEGDTGKGEFRNVEYTPGIVTYNTKSPIPKTVTTNIRSSQIYKQLTNK